MKKWNASTLNLSHKEAVSSAIELGINSEDAHAWDWELLRTGEGYYRVKGGTEYALHRAKHFAPFADVLWMETGKPILMQAQQFAAGVLEAFPKKFLAYNLSPSFNWDSAGMNDDDMRDFITELGRLGFVWQFITLAGFHVNSLAIDRFSRGFIAEGMLA